MILDLEKKLDELIELGEHVKKVNYVKVTEPGLIMPDYISGSEYDLWMNKIKIFASKYCVNHTLYDEIMVAYNSRNTTWGTSAYENMMSYLRALKEDEEFTQTRPIEEELHSIPQKEKMLFISHSSLDIEYVKILVDILEVIGFRSRSLLFCSSLSGYRIPTGKHIYDYLKEQFNKELHVIFLLSENYYSSPACLNEMGATWIKSINHTAILVPEFNYYQIRGVVDSSKVWFKMDDKERLNEFKDSLIAEFELNEIDNNFWERKRDSYLEKVNAIFSCNKYKINPQKVDIEDLEILDSNLLCTFRLINKSNVISRCKKIDVEVVDRNDKKIYFRLSGTDLKDFVIYSNENKRIQIKISLDKIKGIDNFDIYDWKEYKTTSSWSTVL
jgi:hypothetical protein